VRPRRARFTIRRMMVAVAVLALLFAGVVSKLQDRERGQRIRNWYDHKNRAFNILLWYIEPEARHLTGGLAPCPSNGTPPDDFRTPKWGRHLAGLPAAERAIWEAIGRRYDYHIAMWRKWERTPLSSSVEPDPPPPRVPGLDGRFPF
jgi:hypothetical protein